MLEQRLAASDYDGAQRELHTLKGVAGNIGALILQREATRLEQMLLARKIDSTTDLPTSFREAFATLFTGLTVLRQNQELPVASAGEVESDIAGGDFNGLLCQLQQMLTEGEPDAVKVLAPLKRILTNAWQQEQLTRIAAQIGDYNFDGAKQTLDALSTTMTGNKK